MNDQGNTKRKGNGEFFALDYDAWPAVCGLGLNAAVAYVVLARFTGRDNAHTAASIQAIENYTGMARIRAHESIDALIRSRLVERVPESPRTRPRYILRSWCDVFADVKSGNHAFANVLHRLPMLGTYTRKSWPTMDADVEAAARAGLILPGKVWSANEPSAERNLAWMPNAFVTGAASEVPPLRRLRETGTVDALRLVVDLYAAHHLADDGGVSPRVVHQPWVRHVIAQSADYNILGFTRKQGVFDNKPGPICGTFDVQSRAWSGFRGGDAWKTMSALEALGLVEVLTTLYDGPEGEPMFSIDHTPVADAPDANAIRACGVDAHYAAAAWGGDTASQWHGKQPGDRYMLMVPRHVANATLRGIYRLRYRPRTNATARWWGRLMSTTEAWSAKFRELSGHPQLERRSAG